MKHFLKMVFLAGCAAFVGCLVGTSLPTRPSPAPVGLIENSTVALVEEHGGSLEPFCAGVWVSREWILTARHCVSRSSIVEYVNHDDDKDDRDMVRVRVGLVALKDAQKDLALIYSPGPSKHSFAHIANEEKIGTGLPLNIMGHTVGYWWTYSKGYVSRDWITEGPDGERIHVVQVSAPVWMGNSGGGAFDDQGRLIGISSWVSKAGPNLSFFIHASEINKFIDEAVGQLGIGSL